MQCTLSMNSFHNFKRVFLFAVALFDLVLIFDEIFRLQIGSATYRRDPVVDGREQILPCSISNPTATESMEIPVSK